MKFRDWKVWLIATSLLAGCTSGQLEYVDGQGQRKVACDVEFTWHPTVDNYAVEYVLSKCARSVVARGDKLDNKDRYLLELDLSIPEPPEGQVWTHELAKTQYQNKKISAREYGYIVAFIDLKEMSSEDN